MDRDDVRLRVATPEDAAAVADIYRPYVEESAVTFEETPPDAATIADRIESKLETYPWFVAETSAGTESGTCAETDERGGENRSSDEGSSGDVIGYAYAGSLRDRPAYRWTTELSVYLDQDARGRGVGSALYRALLATLERQGFQSAYGVVTLPNPESVEFHESLGFERVARMPAAGYKLGEWHDVAWYERGLGERRGDPEEPTPFAACREEAWLESVLEAAADGRASGA